MDRVEAARTTPGEGAFLHRSQDPGGNPGRGGAVRAALTLPEGKTRWTTDEARRRVGRQVTPQEKISTIHTLATDEQVAATVNSDLLRRPTVVAQVEQDDKVRVVEELTRDDHVAAKATTGLLRRPAVPSGQFGRHRPPPGQPCPGRAGPAGPRALRGHQPRRPGRPQHRPVGGVPGPGHRLPFLRRGRGPGRSRHVRPPA